MQELIDKIGFLFLPETFVKILPYCFWQWLVMTAFVIWLIKRK